MSHFNGGVTGYEDNGQLYAQYQVAEGVGKLMEAQKSQKELQKLQSQIGQRTY